MTKSKSVLAGVGNHRGIVLGAGYFGGRQAILLSAVVLIMLSGVTSVRSSSGAESPQQAVKIRQVKIQGNQAVSSDRIFGVVRSRSGAVFNEQLISEDARRIVNLPQVAQVDWEASIVGSEVDVTFIIEESASMQSVKFVGNKSMKEAKLRKELDFGADEFLDDYLIQQGADILEDFYHGKGYYFAHVTAEKHLAGEQWQVLYEIYEGSKVRINKIRFENNESYGALKLKSKIQTKGYFPIFSKGVLDDEKLQQDCMSLQGFYQEEGYLDAEVFCELKPSKDQTQVEVVFVVEEAVPYKVGTILFSGNSDLPADQLMESVGLEQGQVLSQKRRLFAERAVKRVYGELGYIYTTVFAEPQFTDREGDVNVVFNIVEDEKFSLGQLLIQGNDKTKDKVIRRAFDFYDFMPGGLYNTDAMERARNQLLASRMFGSVNVTPSGIGANQRDALVTVTEADTGMFTFGVGVDTNSGVIGNVGIEQQNFDATRPPKSAREFLTGQSFTGGGQRLRFQFSPGTRVTTGHVNFYEPYLFDQPFYLDTDLMLYRRWRESYLEGRRGGHVTVGHRFSNQFSADVSLRAEKVKVSNLDRGAPADVWDVKGDNFLTSVKLGLNYRQTDNIYRPTDGYRMSTSYEQVGALGGEFAYGAVSGSVSYYRTVYMDLTERKTVWSSNVRGSQIIGDAPVFERFYAGGIGTLRGFDYRGVSPRGGAVDDPVGSDFLVLAGTEITHPFLEDVIYGKLFCDTGLVEEGPYRVAVGFGLELWIPAMPVPMQFNFGFPVLFDDKDEREVFSFSMGFTF
ncbi:MAG: outer membrane protein assembly factor BamA [Planctomycetes bacterium]|nr:outer membrane protein assembly factor BamA [Planctomycetota bacterium]